MSSHTSLLDNMCYQEQQQKPLYQSTSLLIEPENRTENFVKIDPSRRRKNITLNAVNTQEDYLVLVRRGPKSKPKKKRIRKYVSNNPLNKKGHWSVDEILKYHLFLQTHYEEFIDKQRRKIDKIFTVMADFIGTRESYQCRSHHQKIQKKWLSFSKIILNLRKQHFKSTKKYAVEKYLRQKVQIHTFQPILQQSQLQDDEKLVAKVVEKNPSFIKDQNQPQHKISNRRQEQFCQFQQNYLQYQDSHYSVSGKQCLMMSQKYEDKLNNINVMY